MRVQIDTKNRTVSVSDGDGERALELYSPEAFEVLSSLWVKVGWALKYSYSFSWLGRPVIQLPEDLVRMQELIYAVRPDVLVETGVAHGGSLIFYASLFKALGRGRVVGVDIEIRPHNRSAIEAHPLASFVTLIEGDSTASAVVERVRACLSPGDRVLVVLDSNHTKDHVAKELRAYAPLVTPGSYVVVTDCMMEDLADVPGGRPEWIDDNPRAAAREFLAAHPEFVVDPPLPPFNEGQARSNITYWSGGYLKLGPPPDTRSRPAD